MGNTRRLAGTDMRRRSGTTSGFVELGRPIVFVETRAKRGPTTIGGDKTHPRGGRNRELWL
jgi:hypothetical protein